MINPDNFGFTVGYKESNYTAGLNIRRAISNKLSIVSGLNYLKQEISKSLICPVCDFSIDALPLQESQRYLQIPIGAAYTVGKKRFRTEFELGIFNNLLVSGSSKDILGNESPKGYYLSRYLGGKVRYQFTKPLDFFLGYRGIRNITSPFSTEFALKSNSLVLGVAISIGSSSS